MKIRKDLWRADPGIGPSGAPQTPTNGQKARAGTGDAPGIVIADGGVGSRLSSQHPRVRAFVYGERIPAAPTLPFGRWKVAS